MVKGLRKAPLKPTWAARYTIHKPVKESYPREIASGTSSGTKATVSSLIPNTAPKSEKSSITATITRLPTPPMRLKKGFPSRAELRLTKERMPLSIAPVAPTSENAAPVMRMKTMMGAWRTKPFIRAEKTCQV